MDPVFNVENDLRLAYHNFLNLYAFCSEKDAFISYDLNVKFFMQAGFLLCFACLQW